MRDFYTYFLLPLTGYFVSYLLRLLRKTRFWNGVQKAARKVLADDGNPITDPEKAAEIALVEIQKPQIEIIGQRLRRESKQ